MHGNQPGNKSFHIGERIATLPSSHSQCCAEGLLQGVELFGKHVAWGPLLVHAAVSGSWSGDGALHAALKRHLAQDRAILQGQVRRIESCFFPVVSLFSVVCCSQAYVCAHWTSSCWGCRLVVRDLSGQAYLHIMQAQVTDVCMRATLCS